MIEQSNGVLLNEMAAFQSYVGTYIRMHASFNRGFIVYEH